MDEIESLKKAIQEEGLTDEQFILEGPIQVRIVEPGSSLLRGLHGLRGSRKQWKGKSDFINSSFLLTNSRLFVVGLRGVSGVGIRPQSSTPAGLAMNLIQIAAKAYKTVRASEVTDVLTCDLSDLQIDEGGKGWVIARIPNRDEASYLLFCGRWDAADGSNKMIPKFVEALYKLKSLSPPSP